MISQADLGWMAGIIDYKGRLVRKNNSTRTTAQITLSVRSKEVALQQHLGLLTGVIIDSREARPLKEWMRRGCTEHCPEQHIHTNGPYNQETMPLIAQWTVTGAALAIVLHSVMPMLRVDRGYRDAYEEILAADGAHGRGSGAVVAAIRRLQMLGWELPKQYQEVVGVIEPAATMEELLAMMGELQDDGSSE